MLQAEPQAQRTRRSSTVYGSTLRCFFLCQRDDLDRLLSEEGVQNLSPPLDKLALRHPAGVPQLAQLFQPKV